jgi:pyruvate formate lyase activating enzyme
MGCSFCQNWDLSKSRADQRRSAALSPEAVVQTAVEHGCQALAFTYNEPTIWAEYVVDISKIARQSGIKTAMVTNGYISKDAFHDVYRYIDAANVDLKAFTESFYHKLTLSHLAPVLAALQRMRHESDVWIEITTLLIPSLNDKDEEIRQLSDWVLENLGADVPIHFTAFHPDYRLLDKPATPPETLRRARKTAKQSGVKFVYEGNIHSDGCNTYCPRCGHLLIRRSWHSVEEYHLKGNYCQCGEFIPGHFPDAGDTIQLGAGAIERLRRIFS